MSKKRKLSNGEAEEVRHDLYMFDYSAPAKIGRPDLLHCQLVPFEANQKLLENASPSCLQLDFNLKSERVILCGPSTRFVITFHIERKLPDEKVDNKTVEHPWLPIPEAEAETESKKMMLIGGWIDYIIKSIDIYYNNTKLSTSNENKFIAAHMNRFIDAIQDKKTIATFAPQETHPYRLTYPLSAECISYTNKSWTEYAKHVLHDGAHGCKFDFFPRNWLFMNGPNFIKDKGTPRALPFPIFGGTKLNIRLTFAEDWSTVFRVTAANTNLYRIRFSDVRLMALEAKCHLTLERNLFSNRKTLHFPGVTRLMQYIAISSANTTYNHRFNEVTIPHGVLVFAVNKKIANGSYAFSKDTSQNVFLDHRITHVDLAFNNERFFIREPNIGDQRNDLFDYERLMNMLHCTPFGLKPDEKALHIDYLKDGGRSASAFPHIFLPLSHYSTGPSSKMVPVNDDGSALSKRGHFDVQLKFLEAGANNEATYVFTLYHLDSNLAFDAKNKNWFNSHTPMY